MSLTCEICIFCYRERSLDSDNDNEELLLGKENTLNRFVELAQRWLKTNLHLHDIGTEHGNGMFGICQDCKFVVDSFCKLYHDWKCLELEVEWRLNKLCSVMKCADRVSWRKQRLDSKFNSSEEGRRFIERVTTFRAELQQKCSQRCSKSLPRVSLKPAIKKEKLSPKLEVNYAEMYSLEPTGNVDPTRMVVSGDDDVVDVHQQIKVETSILILSTCGVSSVANCESQVDTESSIKQNMSPDMLGNEEEQDKPESRTFEPSVLPSFSQIVETPSKKRKRFQTSLTNPNEKLRRREPFVNTNTCFFKCFRCHRNFTTFSHLQRHRRAFTHLFNLAKLRIEVKPDTLRINKNKLKEKNKTSVDSTNFGILRPLRRKEETDSVSSSTSSEEHPSNSSDSSLTATNNKISKRPQKVNRIHQYERPFVCNVGSCQNTFQFEEELELHKKYHGCFPCSFCNKTSKYAPDLALHELLHAKKTTAGKDKLLYHNNKEYHCRRCNYRVGASARQSYINHHLTKHLNLPVQKVMCKLCKAWLSKYGVKVHMNAYHEESESHLKCDQCPAHFDKEHQLYQHKMKEHAATKNGTLHFCDPCQKAFATEPELKTHKRLHGSFPCNFCNVVIAYAPDLVRHEIVQCNSKPENEKNCKKFNCARCKFGTNAMYRCINHYIKFHLFKKTCAICQKDVKAGSQEEIHFQTHHDTTNVDPNDIKKCSKCSAYFLKEDQLRSHISKSHPPPLNGFKKEFPCEMNSCSKSFDFEEELQNHVKQHGNFQCKYCSVVKTYAPNLAVHESSHSQRKDKISNKWKWHCSRCEFRSTQKIHYISHFLTRHLQLPQQLIVCHVCRKTVGKASLFVHNRIYHRTEGVNPSLIQQCEQCPAYFLQKHQLTNHLNQIHKSKDFAKHLKVVKSSTNLLHCLGEQKCSKTFETAEQLENHRKLHGTFSCSTCDEVLTYAPKLALHEIAHTSLSLGEFGTRVRRIRTFKCPKCEMLLGSKIRYINHYLVTHMGLPKDGVKCTNCDESFQMPATLAEHVSRYHNFEGGGGVIVNCDKCPATFGNKLYLIRHKQRFHGEGNLTCVDCGKKLGSRRSLMQHRIKVHNKKEADFPLTCGVRGCERRFENEIGLGWHKYRVHEGKANLGPFICLECRKKCSTILAFRRHMLLHSPNQNKYKKDPRTKPLCL